MAGARAGLSQLIVLAGTAGQVLLGLALTVVLGRALGADDFGFFALVAAGYLFAREATDLGSSGVVAREIASHPADGRRRLEELLAWRTVLGLAFGLAALAAALQQADAARRTVLLAMALTLCASGCSCFQPVFQARQRLLAPTLLSLAGQLALWAACLAALQAGPLGTAPAGWLVLKEALVLAAVAVAGARLAGGWPRLRIGRAALQATLALVGPWAAVALCRHLMAQVELLAVALSRSPAEVGMLAAALRPLSPALMLPWLLAAALVPVLAAAASAHPARGHALLLQALLLAGAVGAVGAAAVSALAPDVVELLYGGRYDEQAASAMQWLAAGIAPVAVSAVVAAALLAWRRERAALAAVAATLAVKLAACAAWVPAGGIVAAARAGLAAELLLAVALGACVLRPLRAAWRAEVHRLLMLLALAGVAAVVLVAGLLTAAQPAWRVAGVGGVAACAIALLLFSRLGSGYRRALIDASSST